MKILVIAHGYPPDDSPQALRTAYQVRELVRAGHEVQVLCPDHGGPDLAQINGQPAVLTRRSYPGPLAGLVAAVSRRRTASPGSNTEAGGSAVSGPVGTSSLNWKGRAIKLVRRVLDQLLFPDSRSEWMPWARPALDRAVAEFSPGVVIAAHEPGVGLRLGLHAKRMHGLPLLVDLGDPVLAPYTPPIWRKRALRLEADVCREADAVVVTSRGTREALIARHRADAEKFLVLPQAFDDSQPESANVLRGGGVTLRLLYTGRFYSFRDPMPLFRAVADTAGVHLSVASPELQPHHAAFMDRHPECMTHLGKVSHLRAQQLQVEADVLVNIGNTDMCQVPGKFFEYFRVARPILHLSEDSADESAAILANLRRGLVSRCDPTSIAASLAKLKQLKSRGTMGTAFDLSRDAVAEFGWRRHGEQLEACCRAIGTRSQCSG